MVEVEMEAVAASEASSVALLVVLAMRAVARVIMVQFLQKCHSSLHNSQGVVAACSCRLPSCRYHMSMSKLAQVLSSRRRLQRDMLMSQNIR